MLGVCPVLRLKKSSEKVLASEPQISYFLGSRYLLYLQLETARCHRLLEYAKTKNKIPLCVPFERRPAVKAAGGRWDAHNRLWYCTEKQWRSSSYHHLKPFLPRRFLRDLQGPVIRPFMVPRSLWGKNLRAVLEIQDWNIVRKAAYERSGYRCCVCGEQGLRWPVEADEAWHYDDHAKKSTLRGVIALCPDCHAIRHWGRTCLHGDINKSLERMIKLNGWSREYAAKVVEQENTRWINRSNYDWNIDYSWVQRVHDISLKADAERCEKDANRQFVEERDTVDHHASTKMTAQLGEELYFRTEPVMDALDHAARMHRTQFQRRDGTLTTDYSRASNDVADGKMTLSQKALKYMKERRRLF